MINRKRILDEFYELVQIKCSTRAERQVADVIKQKLVNLHTEVTEDDTGGKIGGNCGNVIAFLPGTAAGAPGILFTAHLDCVEPCGNIQPVLKDGIITSAGDTILGSDDKSGVVAILEVLRVIKEQNIPHGNIQVVFTVAEEGGLNGSKNIDPSLLKADFGYALDSSGSPGEIVNMAPGQNQLEIIVHGKKAHAGVAPEEGINAIVLAGKALAGIRDGRIDQETTANIGIIEGGTATNIVPDKVKIVAEARSRNMEKLTAQTEHMRQVFEETVKASGGRAEVSISKKYDAYVLPETAPVVQLARQAAESIGLTPVIKATGGGSDANFFNSYGVPTVVLGTGMSKVHTTDEFIKEEDLYNICAFTLAIVKAAGQANK
ncbi:M20/M25/M40 family metallo-hydrolase [Sporomusa acidovorans]|uniref:Peptidase T n=1 Tax=Sporomusa acidovorans (strain ATCC 49682 / DSM 3132 / Mol) TaxID=1123286 RepID=A0ABZ3JAG7_SPOA4|nr:M20/M25/M40 family metallo-hydrolase [Sporomusa acidovorans]OZC13307.1 peptidase T [Sporomusa acidovorans DSM 3132]SDD97327.1 peptidase T-like protein [Sporomusa acidovorans]